MFEMAESKTKAHATEQKRKTLSAVEVMKLPFHERMKLLSQTSSEAESIYAENKNLTDFEAFGNDDLYERTP